MRPAAGNRELLVGEGMGTATCPVRKGQKDGGCATGGPGQCFPGGFAQTVAVGCRWEGDGQVDGRTDKGVLVALLLKRLCPGEGSWGPTALHPTPVGFRALWPRPAPKWLRQSRQGCRWAQGVPPSPLPAGSL